MTPSSPTSRTSTCSRGILPSRVPSRSYALSHTRSPCFSCPAFLLTFFLMSLSTGRPRHPTVLGDPSSTTYDGRWPLVQLVNEFQGIVNGAAKKVLIFQRATRSHHLITLK